MHTGVNMANLTERLNQIYDIITTEDFLKCRGLGNEIAFYIFDYPPEEELTVRDHIDFMLKRIKSQTGFKVADINLFEFVVDHLKSRNLFDKSCEVEVKHGISQLEKAVRAPLKPENLVKLFQEKVRPEEYDLTVVRGIGNAWPLARAHSLLNNLQPIMKSKPLVLFYPGTYDKQSFNLFGKLKSNAYYRAFPLIP